MRTPRGLRTLAVTVMLALLATACSILPGGGSYEIEAEFRRTFNLFPGSPVRVLGIEVGRIADVVVEPGSDVVTATLQLEEGIQLPEDVTALVVVGSLLGERYVQLDPPYVGDGPTFAAGGTIPVTRTQVPFEFDEVLESLNRFVGGLEGDEVGRLFANLATVLDGQGAHLGDVIDQAHDAVGVLRENDDDLLTLLGRLADLNATLATRDDELGDVIEDFNTVAATLVDDRVNIDRALSGLVRLTEEVGDVLSLHRTTLQQDVETVTRVGRTLDRNLDHLSTLILYTTELYYATELVVERDRNWLPLLNHSGELATYLGRSLAQRLRGLCLAAGLGDVCTTLPIEDILGELCLPPLVTCAPGDNESGAAERRTIGEALADVAEAEPRLGDLIRENLAGAEDGPLADVLGDVGASLRGEDA